jgi:hypothetical protein
MGKKQKRPKGASPKADTLAKEVQAILFKYSKPNDPFPFCLFDAATAMLCLALAEKKGLSSSEMDKLKSLLNPIIARDREMRVYGYSTKRE